MYLLVLHNTCTLFDRHGKHMHHKAARSCGRAKFKFRETSDEDYLITWPLPALRVP